MINRGTPISGHQKKIIEHVTCLKVDVGGSASIVSGLLSGTTHGFPIGKLSESPDSKRREAAHAIDAAFLLAQRLK